MLPPKILITAALVNCTKDTKGKWQSVCEHTVGTVRCTTEAVIINSYRRSNCLETLRPLGPLRPLLSTRHEEDTKHWTPRNVTGKTTDAPSAPAARIINEHSSDLVCTKKKGVGTCASMSRCLIRVMDFFRVSLSPGMKASSSSARWRGLVTMKWAMWSFRLLRDWTAAKREQDKTSKDPERFRRFRICSFSYWQESCRADVWLQK